MSPLRILIASADLASQLQSLVLKWSGFAVVGTVERGEDLIPTCKRCGPHLVMLDLALPGLAKNDLQKLKLAVSKTKVLIVTNLDSEVDVFASLAAGADGYLLASKSLSSLQAAVQATVSGALWLDGQISPKVKSTLLQILKLAESPNRMQGLKEYEYEVLELVSQGFTNKEIAVKLEVPVDTVKSRLKSIMKKLSVSDRTEAAIVSLKHNPIF